MKRFLSILIALILVFSLFSVTAVAFADEQGEDNGDDVAKRTVTFHADVFKEKVFDVHPLLIDMNKEFMLDGKITVDDKEVVWYQNEKLLHEIFEGINYIELKDEDIVEPEEGEELDESVPVFELQYDYNLGGLDIDKEEGEEEVELPENPTVEKYQETQHVTLNNAPDIKGYAFAGWTIDFNGKSDEYENYDNFPAGFEFNMPATKVTVTANWEKLEKDEDGEYVDAEVEFYSNDLIFLLYCNPSSAPQDDMEDWEYCAVTGDFDLTTTGWWSFRFAVVDGMQVTSASSFKYSDEVVLATTFDNVLEEIEKGEKTDAELQQINYTLVSHTSDVTPPVVSLSDSLLNKSEEGLTVGESYTVSDTLDIEDASGTTVTFKIYKKVGNVEGAVDGWLLIYDGHTEDLEERITDGYEDNISVSGSSVRIKPLASDVTGDFIYKIEYFVKDSNGFFGVKEAGDSEEYNPVLYLKVHEATKTPDQKAIEAWKIVLYVIAGLAAVGIVVLLFIKPKQQKAADPRFSANATAESDADDKSDDKKE